MRWMASVATSIASSDVHNHHFGAVCLDLKGGDESVFCLDDHMLGFALKLQPNSEKHWTLLAPLARFNYRRASPAL